MTAGRSGQAASLQRTAADRDAAAPARHELPAGETIVIPPTTAAALTSEPARPCRPTPAMAPTSSSSDDIETLVRIVRADAEPKRQRACAAAFLAALAETAPDVVSRPRASRAWRRDQLAALAAATTRRLESKRELHCVVGTGEFSANLRYARGSLVYLRAASNPPLRALLYASLPAPPGTDPAAVGPPPMDADADSDAEAHRPSTDGTEPTHRHRAVIVDASDASPALVSATLDALSSDPPAEVAASAGASASGSSAKTTDDTNTSMSASRAAAWRSARLRDQLTDRFGAHWHVIHDAETNPFGAAPAVAARGRACVASRDGSVFLAFHHVAAPLTLLQSLGLVTRAGGGELYRAARAMTLVVAVAYALWYRSMCVRPGEFVDFGFLGDVAEALADAFEFTGAGAGFGDRVEAPGDLATRAAKANRGTGGGASGASSSPLAALEKPLTAALCAAGPRVAPVFAVAAAATFASYSLATFRRLARRAAGRRKNKTKAA